MARILTGIQSSGVPHLGNLLGAIIPAISLSEEKQNESFFFIADLHSLTTIKDSKVRKKNVFATAATWLSFGFDAKKNTFYRQSYLPEVTELTWYLSCFAPYPMLANATAFKEKSSKLSDVNVGLFLYPILQAADILGYDVDIVPVGKDQQQNLEITRDIAKHFNHFYQDEVFVVPEAKINKKVEVIKGTDGQKMSKSYNNFINIFADEKTIKKQIMSIITDSIALEAPKKPENCNVFRLFEHVASSNDVALMRSNYLNGGYGFGHAKKELLGCILDKYKNERLLFEEYMKNTDKLEQILKEGEDKARSVLTDVIRRVKLKLGFL